jgi:hypothetical protein
MKPWPKRAERRKQYFKKILPVMQVSKPSAGGGGQHRDSVSDIKNLTEPT